MRRMHVSLSLLVLASVAMSGLVGCSNTSTTPSSNNTYWPDHENVDDPAERLLAEIQANNRAAASNAAPTQVAADPVVIDAGTGSATDGAAGTPTLVIDDTPKTYTPTPAPKVVVQPIDYQPTPAPKVYVQPRQNVAVAGSRTYTVKRGDSLWVISRRMYGKGSKWKTIANANPKVNPEKLQLGQKLVIPALASAKTGSGAPAEANRAAAVIDDDAQFK